MYDLKVIYTPISTNREDGGNSSGVFPVNDHVIDNRGNYCRLNYTAWCWESKVSISRRRLVIVTQQLVLKQASRECVYNVGLVTRAQPGHPAVPNS